MDLWNKPNSSLQKYKNPIPNEFPGYDTKLDDALAASGNIEHSFIAITISSTLIWSSSTY